jgi:transcriptional regulator with XRE-family HTH domain
MYAFQNLLDKGIFSSITEISEKTGISRSTISETVNLNQLPEATQKLLLEKQVQARELHRTLIKSPQNEHEKIIRTFEEGKQKAKLRRKKSFEPKIKVLNIIHHANNFTVENNRLEELTTQQKQEIKKILLSIIEKI